MVYVHLGELARTKQLFQLYNSGLVYFSHCQHFRHSAKTIISTASLALTPAKPQQATFFITITNIHTEVSLLTTFKRCLAGFPRCAGGELCTDRTYLAVVSVESLQLLDVSHADALRQRMSAQVRRGKWRQGVRCICIKRGKKCSQLSLLLLRKMQTRARTHTR